MSRKSRSAVMGCVVICAFLCVLVLQYKDSAVPRGGAKKTTTPSAELSSSSPSNKESVEVYSDPWVFRSETPTLDEWSVIKAPAIIKQAPSAAELKEDGVVEQHNNYAIRYKKREILLKFSRNADESEIQNVLARHNLELVATDKKLAQIGYIKVRVAEDADLKQTIGLLRKDSPWMVTKAEPNFIISAMSIDDPYYPDQWYVQATRFDQAWEVMDNTNSVIVAVIDTGVDSNHPDLEGKCLGGWSAIDANEAGSDDNGHGTFVAGIIAANWNDKGIRGLCPNSRILPVKALDSTGSGTYEDVAVAVIYATDHGAKVINLSLGGYAYSSVLQDAVDYALEQGIVLVAAGGNDGIDQEMYPAAYPDVIGVGSVGISGEVLPSSNTGFHIACVAPAENIFSLGLNREYTVQSGSSASSAIVSSLAATVLSEKNSISSAALRRAITQSSTDICETGVDSSSGYGLVDSYVAIVTWNEDEFHDLAVDRITLESKTIPRADRAFVNVTVANLGTYKSETCSVVLYQNDGLEERQVAVRKNIKVIGSKQLSFHWDATGVSTNVGAALTAEVIADNDACAANNTKSIKKIYARGEDGVTVLYKVEPPVHQWIAFQAYNKLPAGALKTELSGYLPTSSSSGYYDEGFEARSDSTSWYTDDDMPGSYDQTALIEGTWEEDHGDALINLFGYYLPSRPINHFWNPDGGYDDGIVLDGYLFDSAYETAQERFSQAVSFYNSGDIKRAYYWLGRTAHLLMDMSVPAHVQKDPHAWDFIIDDTDEYEDFTSSWSHYNHTTSGSPNTAIPTSLTTYSGDPAAFHQQLGNLFYTLAQYTDQFDSDDKDGDSSTYGGGRYRRGSNYLNPDKTFYRAYKIVYSVLAGGYVQDRLLASPADYEIVSCAWSRDVSFIFSSSFYEDINEVDLDGVRVYYTDGSYDEDFTTIELENDVSWAVCGELFQPQLEARAIGYVAALYQLFWDETHASSITISGPDEVNENDTAQYSCTATYTDGSTKMVTPTWSENSSYTTIDSSGLLSASSVSSDKSVTVTASYDGKTDTHSVTIKNVPPTLSSIAISGPTEVDENDTAQYTCTATYSDGSTQTVTPTWSENSSYTTIDSSGLLTASSVTSDKSVTITATYSGKSDTHSVTVMNVPQVTSIAISGATSVDEVSTAQYSCTAYYDNGTSSDVSSSATWSENSSYASINSSGLLTTTEVSSDQSATITATYGGKSDTHAITIKNVPKVSSVAVSGPASVDEESSAQYSCLAYYDNGTSVDVTSSATWSENSVYASIDGQGVLVTTSVSSDQSATVTASYGGASDSLAVTIKNIPPPTSITISGPASVNEGGSATYTCRAYYGAGSSKIVTPIWSDNSSYASINASGVMSAGSVSSDTTVTLTASYGGQNDTHVVTIKNLYSLTVNGGSGGGSYVDGYSVTITANQPPTGRVFNGWIVSPSQYASRVGTNAVANFSMPAADLNVTAVFDPIGSETGTIYPLEGFTNKWVAAYLWDYDDEAYSLLDEPMLGPTEVEIGGLVSGRWYWLCIMESSDGVNWSFADGSWVMREETK